MKTDRRSAATTPGPKPGVVVCAVPDFRSMEPDGPINFDDFISEEHAKQIVNVLRPLLVGEWRIHPTEVWGRYILKSPGWVERYEIRTLFQVDQIKVVIRVEKTTSLGPPGAFGYWPLEYPHIIEAAAHFVFEQMKYGYNVKCFINRPTFPATEERKEQPSSMQGTP